MAENQESSTDFNDPLYEEGVAFVTKSRNANTSAVQRFMRIGYNRAARMIERMEREGIVGPMQATGGREVIEPYRRSAAEVTHD